jgi:hypothetical protein
MQAQSVVVPRLGLRVTEHLFSARTGSRTLPWGSPASVVGVLSGSPTQRCASADYVVGGRIVEPPTPAQIVLPACGWRPALAPEGDPPRFLIAGNPRPLEATFLVEGHDVTHTGTVA